MVVVLPEPSAPRNRWTSPASTDKSRPSRARVDPNVFTRPEMEIACGTPPIIAPAPRRATSQKWIRFIEPSRRQLESCLVVRVFRSDGVTDGVGVGWRRTTVDVPALRDYRTDFTTDQRGRPRTGGALLRH